MYHQVTPQRCPTLMKYAVTPQAFADQMEWLAAAAYTPISLDALLDHRRGQGAVPSQPVIITFDDGFQDCIDYAVPILQAHGFTAIFYLVAGLMGKTSRWLMVEQGTAFPLLGWTAARGLETAGFYCGAHTMTHPHLADLSPAACREELQTSRRLLEDHLGHEVRHLAYPFGSFNDQVRAAAAEAGYRSACSVRPGLSTLDDDPLALHRVHVSGHDSLLDFMCRLKTTHSLGELLRGRAHAARRLWRKGALSTR